MDQLVVIATGATSEIGASHTQAAMDLIKRYHGRIVSTAPSLGVTRPMPKLLATELLALGLWGLHHREKSLISTDLIQARIGIDRSRVNATVRRMASPEVNWLVSVGTAVVPRGRAPKLYRLTPTGVTQVEQVFARIISGSRIVADFGKPIEAIDAAWELQKLQGVMVPDGKKRGAVPYNVEVLILSACWILEQSGVAASAIDIQEQLSADPGSVQTPLQTLIWRHYLTMAGVVNHRRRYQLTETGDALVQQWLPALLG